MVFNPLTFITTAVRPDGPLFGRRVPRSVAVSFPAPALPARLARMVEFHFVAGLLAPLGRANLLLIGWLLWRPNVATPAAKAG